MHLVLLQLRYIILVSFHACLLHDLLLGEACLPVWEYSYLLPTQRERTDQEDIMLDNTVMSMMLLMQQTELLLES